MGEEALWNKAGPAFQPDAPMPGIMERLRSNPSTTWAFVLGPDVPKVINLGKYSSRERPTPKGRSGVSPRMSAANIRLAASDNMGTFRQSFIAINLALSYVIVGASIAWAAPVLYRARKTGDIAGQTVTETEGTIVGSILFLASAVTPIPCAILSEWIGRKMTLIIAGITSCISWILLAFVNNIGMLYMSRVLAGFLAGAVLTVVPLYIAEIARPKIRGTLASINPSMLTSGSLLTFSLGPNVEVTTLAICCGVLPHVFVVLMFFLPESPHWLLRKHSYQKAQKSFEWLRGKKLSRDESLRKEFDEIAEAVMDRHSTNTGLLSRFRGLCSDKANRRALLIVEILTAAQRLAGVTAILAYTVLTLPDVPVGFLRPSDCLTALGVVWLISNIFSSVVLIDRLGRVPLLMVSSAGCFFATVTVSTWFFAHRTITIKDPGRMIAPWFPFVTFMVYGAFYVIGLGSVPGILQGEMFPEDHKDMASAITVIIMSVTSCFINSIFVSVSNTWGIHVNFILYSFACTFTLLFTLASVPETKGKPLCQIQKELNEEV